MHRPRIYIPRCFPRSSNLGSDRCHVFLWLLLLWFHQGKDASNVSKFMWIRADGRMLFAIFGTIILDCKFLPRRTKLTTVMCSFGPLFPIAQYTLAVSSIHDRADDRKHSSLQQHAISQLPWPAPSSYSPNPSTISSSPRSSTNPSPSAYTYSTSKIEFYTQASRKIGTHWQKKLSKGGSNFRNPSRRSRARSSFSS